MLKRFGTKVAVATLVVGGIVGGVGGPAVAAAPDRPSPTAAHKVIDLKTVSTAYVDKSHQIQSCLATKSGGSCSISIQKSVSASAQAALGMTEGWVEGQIGIQAGYSVSVTVTCNSPALSAGQQWHAWPMGTRSSYKIQEFGAFIPTTTSGTLYSFKPTGFACG